MVQTVFALILSYVLGSVPTGLWLGLWLKKVDIREHGSKNIGATNTLRVLGKGMGIVALAGDVCKGLLAVLLLARISPWAYAPLACGAAAVFGHTASVFLKFRGGKGVATSVGVFLALCPVPILVAGVVFFTVVALTRMVSAGSCTGAIAFTVCVYAFPPAWTTFLGRMLPELWTLRVVVTVLLAMVLVKHRGNIRRMLKGQEHRI